MVDQYNNVSVIQHNISIIVQIIVIQLKAGNNHVIQVHVMQHQCVIKRDHFHVLMVYVIVQVLSGGIHRHALLKVNKKRSCFNIMMGFVLGTYLDSCTTGQTFQCQD
jgi:hypothetical protein